LIRFGYSSELASKGKSQKYDRLKLTFGGKEKESNVIMRGKSHSEAFSKNGDIKLDLQTSNVRLKPTTNSLGRMPSKQESFESQVKGKNAFIWIDDLASSEDPFVGVVEITSASYKKGLYSVTARFLEHKNKGKNLPDVEDLVRKKKVPASEVMQKLLSHDVVIFVDGIYCNLRRSC
jgi:hypothetical protein